MYCHFLQVEMYIQACQHPHHKKRNSKFTKDHFDAMRRQGQYFGAVCDANGVSSMQVE
jgi:hypothetical protein